MVRSLLLAALLSLPQILCAGEKVAVTNFYVVNYEEIEAGAEVFWKVSGGGVYVYGDEVDTFTMRWQVVRLGVNKWHIVSLTGKYSGMPGAGTTKTRITSKFLKLAHRISDWEGEIELPKRDSKSVFDTERHRFENGDA